MRWRTGRSRSCRRPKRARVGSSTRPPRRGKGPWHPGGGGRRLLTGWGHGLVEIVDQIVKHAVPVEFGLEVHEHRAEPDRGAIHKDEFARRPDPAEPADVAMHALCNGGAIGSAALF